MYSNNQAKPFIEQALYCIYPFL